MGDIDAVDYAILRCINAAETPLWKTAIHDRLQPQIQELPRIDSITLQTVGRHMNRLHEQSYVTSDIVEKAAADRDLMIGYRITERGTAAMERKQTELLKYYIQHADELLTEQDEDTVQQTAVTLFERECELDDASVSFLQEECEAEEVLALIELFYATEYVHNHGDLERLRSLARLLQEEGSSDVSDSCTVNNG